MYSFKLNYFIEEMKEIKNHLDQRDFCESHLHMSQMPNVQCPNLTGTMFKAQFKKKKKQQQTNKRTGTKIKYFQFI